VVREFRGLKSGSVWRWPLAVDSPPASINWSGKTDQPDDDQHRHAVLFGDGLDHKVRAVANVDVGSSKLRSQNPVAKIF